MTISFLFNFYFIYMVYSFVCDILVFYSVKEEGK